MEPGTPAQIDALVALRSEASTCTKCPLAGGRTKVVFGTGNVARPPVAFVGEAPGQNEDLSGLPFVGRAGAILDEFIAWMGYTREQVYILNPVMCFPGATVVCASGIEKIYRRWYEGPLLKVHTEKGDLSGTPNHPVFSSRGRLPLSRLLEGDDLIHYPVLKRVGFGDPDIEHAPTKFDQLFRTLSDVGIRKWMVDSHVNFHGDGGHANIEVVTPYRLLRGHSNPALSDPTDQEIFEGSDHLFCFLKAASTRFGNSLRFFERAYTAVTSCVRSFSEFLSLLLCHLAQPGLHSGGAVSYRDTGFQEQLLERSLPNMNFPGQRFQSSATQVALAKILKIERKWFSGHVYNLQTRSGQYIADGMLVSNCRPPRNRQPAPAELAACRPYFERQLELVRPLTVVALGRVATTALLAPTLSTAPLSSLRGIWHNTAFGPTRVSYHPAYIARNPSARTQVYEDLRAVREWLDHQIVSA